MMPLLADVPALLTKVFVAGMWQGLALALLGVALCSLLSSASARLRHTILVILFAGALVLPWLHLRGRVPAAQSHGVFVAQWIAGAIALLWFAAFAMRAVQLCLAWRQLCAVRRNATPILVQGIGALCGGRRRAILCSSPDVDSPAILGLGSPRLLLPDWMVPSLSETELRLIALHECEHLRRGDDWSNLLLQVAIALSPLNPALLWLNRRISVQRELAADAAVVAETAQPLSYAACLTRFAEARQRRGRLRLALAAWERRSELVQRVHVLLDSSSRFTPGQSAWATSGAITAVLLAVTGMLYAPQLVRTGSTPVVAVDQPLAVVVSTARLTIAPRSAEAASAQMIQAAFQVPSRPPTAAFTRRGKTVHVNATSPHKPATSQGADKPRLMRTSAVLSQRAGAERLLETYSGNDRLITADFRTSYVAVPTQSGWLLIEL